MEYSRNRNRQSAKLLPSSLLDFGEKGKCVGRDSLRMGCPSWGTSRVCLRKTWEYEIQSSTVAILKLRDSSATRFLGYQMTDMGEMRMLFPNGSRRNVAQAWRSLLWFWQVEGGMGQRLGPIRFCGCILPCRPLIWCRMTVGYWRLLYWSRNPETTIDLIRNNAHFPKHYRRRAVT